MRMSASEAGIQTYTNCRNAVQIHYCDEDQFFLAWAWSECTLSNAVVGDSFFIDVSRRILLHLKIFFYLLCITIYYAIRVLYLLIFGAAI